MRKFTVQSRKGETIIHELDVEIVTALTDASVMWLKPGEYRARILKPESFHMKRERVVDGKKETYMEPDIWCWHALYDDYNEALKYAVKLIEHEFEFNLRKYKTAYTDADVAAATLAIRLEKLPGSTFQTDAEKIKALTPSEFIEKAKAAGHDSLGLCCEDPELEEVFKKLEEEDAKESDPTA